MGRKTRLDYLAPVQESKRVPKRSAALGDYVVSSPGLPSRGGGDGGEAGLYEDECAWLSEEDEEEEDGLPPRNPDGTFYSASGLHAPAKRAAPDGAPSAHGGAQAGTWAAAAVAAAAAPVGGPTREAGSSAWLDFSEVLEACVKDGALSESAAARLRRLSYAHADVTRQLFDHAAQRTVLQQERAAFLLRAQSRLEGAEAATQPTIAAA